MWDDDEEEKEEEEEDEVKNRTLSQMDSEAAARIINKHKILFMNYHYMRCVVVSYIRTAFYFKDRSSERGII